MGQREKAQAIVNELFEFKTTTGLSGEQILEAARRAADASKSKLNGSVQEDKTKLHDDGGMAARYRLKGPGGLVGIMTFTIVAVPADGERLGVVLDVEDFTFQKGSLGMKPTIAGKKVMGTFVDVLKTELAAG